MRLKILFAIIFFALLGCKEYKTKKFIVHHDYGSWTSGFNQFKLDSLINTIEQEKYTGFNLDIYPFQFGPEKYGTNGKLVNDVHSFENAWDLSKLFESKSLDSLSIHSLCNFKAYINKNSNLKYLALSSHSCGRVQSRVEIDFSKMTQLEELSLKRQILRQAESRKIGDLRNIEKLTFNDCEIDIKDIINLKSSLTYLDLTNSKVENWHLLSEFKQLKVLYIGNIENVVLRNKENTQFLSNLKHLRELSVKRNSINNLDCILNLKKLKKLYIQQTEIKEIPKEIINRKVEIIKSDY